MEAVPSDKSSTPFGRYLIRERIAEGGMGEVFLAVAVGADGFEKSVVIKRLLPKFAGRTDIVSLLSREAKLMTRLIHPNIVQVIDFGRGENDDYFLVMELVGGTDLGQFCRANTAGAGRVPVPLALFITLQMLRGLAYAHTTASADGKRLVHRDISPGNVLLSTFGEVKIADFGVALVVSAADHEGQDGWLVGKPAYMAPEQLARGAVDERADLYSIGAVLFQTLTGSPHRAATDTEASAGATADLSSATRAALDRVASQELALVVTRALAERPEDRYASAREMSQAIERLVEHGQKVATADDLAQAVTAAAQHEPHRRKAVLLLSTEEQDSLASGTELRRSSKVGAGEGFTIKIRGESVRPALPSPAGGAESTDLPAAQSNRRVWILAGAALSLAALSAGLVARGARQPPVSPREITATESSPPTSSGQSETVAPATVVQPAVPSSGVALSVIEPPPAAASVARPKETTKEPAGATGHDPQPTCRGQLHVYATHGWLLAGGPGTVQAPGRYDWPCGTYLLKATSRVDGRDSRSVSVTIHEAAAGVIDLR